MRPDDAATRRILIVEDNPGDAELLLQSLREPSRLHFRSEVAETLDEAMAYLHRGGFDLVVLDLNVGDSWGVETFHRIHTRHPQIPIVVLTGEEDEELGLELVEQGAQEYLRKSELSRCTVSRCLGFAMARQRTENALREAQERAAGAAQAQSVFIASMSHEIRTPLTAILGMAELLMETRLDEEQEGYVNALHRCGQSLLAILNNILELSRVESGRVTIKSAPFGVREVVDQTVATFAYVAEKKGVALCADVAFEVPERALGDVDRVRQILSNLLANALKFTSRGHVLVRVGWAAAHGDRGARLRLEVCDTGIGIDEEETRWIFERFAQANALVARKFGGSGLGLAICKELVEAMDGALSVRGEPGRGSTFSLELPMEALDDGSEVAAPAEALRGWDVLVVDDTDLERELVVSWLRALGARVREAANGMEALGALEGAEASPDAVVLDARMPGRGGLELVGALREAGRGAARVVMMLPAAHRSGDLRRCRELGVQPVLKPLSAEGLLAALRPDAQERKGRSAAVQDCRDLEGVRVLVVDDSEENRAIIVAFLRKSGCELDVVENGAEAVSAARIGDYDVILMDMRMPVLDGYEATRVIRRLEEREGRPRVPIVALTAYAFQEQARACLAAGCDAHVAKPIDRAALCDTVAAFTRRGRASACGGARVRVSPDPEIADLVPGYLESRRRDVEVLRDALRGGDLETVARLGHNMKGTGSGYGLPRVSELGAELEEAAKGGDVDGIRDRVTRLEAFLEHVEVVQE